MAYYLTIDQGNTRVKVDIWSDNGGMIVSSKTLGTLQPSDLEEVCQGYKPVAAIYCTVGRRDGFVMESLRKLAAHAVEMSVNTPMPLCISYDTPQTLGLDRVAAAAGAYSISGGGADILVIDIGTAVTYDIVSGSGVYRGGNIAPGLDMRLRALNHFTARLPLVSVDDASDVPVWGTDTVSAMRAGAIGGIVGEILYYRRCAGASVRTVVTGGQASLVLRHLPFQPLTHPHLVAWGFTPSYDIISNNEDNHDKKTEK